MDPSSACPDTGRGWKIADVSGLSIIQYNPDALICQR